MQVVGQGADADKAIALVERHMPDLMCLDISMPGGVVSRRAHRGADGIGGGREHAVRAQGWGAGLRAQVCGGGGAGFGAALGVRPPLRPLRPPFRRRRLFPKASGRKASAAVGP